MKHFILIMICSLLGFLLFMQSAWAQPAPGGNLFRSSSPSNPSPKLPLHKSSAPIPVDLNQLDACTDDPAELCQPKRVKSNPYDKEKVNRNYCICTKWPDEACRVSSCMIISKIKQKANLNILNKDGESMLMRADSAYGVALLLAAGANVNKHGKTRGNVFMYHDDSDIISHLANAGADVNERIGKDKLTPLMLAPNAWAFNALIHAGADVNARDAYGRSTLLYARSEGSVKMLLRLGVGPNTEASKKGYPDNPYAIDLLMHAMNLDLPFYNIKNLEAAQLLIAAGVDINKKGQDNGETALMISNNVDSQKILLEAGADLHARDNYGNTALHYVQSVESAKLLIEAGLDVNVKNNAGKVPIMSVRENNIARYLVSQGSIIQKRTKKKCSNPPCLIPHVSCVDLPCDQEYKPTMPVL